MANELVHGTVGTTMTQAEFEAVGLHVLNSQATGDLIYASSATQLSRLAIGAADTVLTCNGTIPAWSATPILNTAIAKGTWTASGTWAIPAVTLSGNMTIAGYAFDAGAGQALITTTSSNTGLRIASSGDPHGPAFTMAMTHNTPEVTAALMTWIFEGYDGATPAVAQNMGAITITYTNVTDGAEAVKMVWNLWDAGIANESMILLGNGTLSVDLSGGGAAAQVDLFDEYDDALILRQGIQQNKRELLADIGVLTRKDTGSGYMMNLQPMVRLLAGGIYQTRQMLEDKVNELKNRLDSTERKLKLLGG